LLRDSAIFAADSCHRSMAGSFVSDVSVVSTLHFQSNSLVAPKSDDFLETGTIPRGSTEVIVMRLYLAVR
jgi:hypothetical protein